MKLRIENFAKIKNAEIIIDGITVIAGKNNTGKSTVGKVLYAVFNSLYDLDHKIEKRRESEIYNICFKYIRNMAMHNNKQETESWSVKYSNLRRLHELLAKDFVKELLESDIQSLDTKYYINLLEGVLEKRDLSFSKSDVEEFVYSTYDKVAMRIKNDNKKIAEELIGRYFVQIFGTQIQCLKNPEATAKIQLTLNEKDGYISFDNNICTNWGAEYNVLHEAFLIDNPFVLDEVTDFAYLVSRGVRGALAERLRERLRESEKDIMEGLFDAVSAKENLKEIYEKINEVASGDIA